MLKKYRYEEYGDFELYKPYEILYRIDSYGQNIINSSSSNIKGVCLKKKIEGYLCLFEIKEDMDALGIVSNRYFYDTILINVKNIIWKKELNKSIIYFCNQDFNNLTKKNIKIAEEIFYMYSENKIA